MGGFFSYVMLSGYGGGFNERENVEYIEREESDGEYDEVSVIWYPKIAALMFDKWKILASEEVDIGSVQIYRDVLFLIPPVW